MVYGKAEARNHDNIDVRHGQTLMQDCQQELEMKLGKSVMVGH